MFNASTLGDMSPELLKVWNERNESPKDGSTRWPISLMCRLYRPQIRTVIRGRGSGPDERPESAADALDRAAAFYAGHGIVIERVLTDNGGPYRSRRYAAELERHGIRHKRTRPYRPQTNGKPSG